MSNESENKKPGISKKVIILIVTALVIIAACAVALIIYFGSSGGENLPEDVTVSATEQTTATVAEISETVLPEGTTVSESTTEEQQTEEAATAASETQKVVPPEPENSDSEKSYFSETYTAYKAIDNDTKSECALREVFGSSYSASDAIVFELDGTFSDGLITSSFNTGAYYTAEKKIFATYSNDKNMNITVLVWNENIPERFIINYGGYDVYFKSTPNN